MKAIDLTHTIAEHMPVYPGTEPPTLSVPCTVEKDGFKETLLRMFSHTGTHIDAPAHLFENGATLDTFDASQFVGTALVIDCSALKEGEQIDMSFIDRNREKAEQADFLLFRTDCGRVARGGASARHPRPHVTRSTSPDIARHAARLIASHPATGKSLDLSSPLPPDWPPTR